MPPKTQRLIAKFFIVFILVSLRLTACYRFTALRGFSTHICY
jgi:hypothetical protein